MNPCAIQVAYGTRQTRSNSGTRSLGIKKKGNRVQVSPPSNGGNTNTTAVKSVVQEASTPAQHGLLARSQFWTRSSISYLRNSRKSTPPPQVCHFDISMTGSS